MIKVFVSSTFRDLKDERRLLIERLNEALLGVGMEGFYPDGKTSQEKGIEELKKSEAVIFIVSPNYGSLIKKCIIPGCKNETECKDWNISYTHCEFRIARAENKLYQTYLIHKGWNLVDQLKDLEESELKFVKKFKDFEGISDDEILHWHEISKKALKFKEEVETKFCKRIENIDDIPQITEHLANNIVNWYSENKIDLMDFFGRREQLKELIEKMCESVEVYGIGGVGKTTLIHIALLIQKLKGKKIIAVCLAQSESSGSGYGFFKKKYIAYPTLKNDVISLDDIMGALTIPDNIRQNTDIDLKIREISQKLTSENIFLFIDDFQFADENVSKLVKKGGNFVIATKKQLNIARNSISLSGIESNEIDAFIGWLAGRFNKKISPEITEKIFHLAQGHPLSTEILLRNYEKIDFDEFENYRSGLDMCNEEQVEEFIKRVVKDILSHVAFDLLKDLSNINPELEYNLDRKALKKTYSAGFDKNFNELIDAGMLDKKNNTEGIYEFTYRHIRDILKDDTKERHERAKEYYENKIDKNHDDEVEILYHRSISSPDENLINDFLELKEKLSPVHYGFRRMVDVGELLRKPFNDEIKAPVCVTLGSLYGVLRKFEAAESAYTEALKIYKKLVEKIPEVYLPRVARTQNNIGALYSDLRKFDATESAYTEALKIYKKLAKKAPNVYLPDVAAIQNNLGNLYCDLRKFDAAKSAFTEALTIRKKLVKKIPDVYLPVVAETQNNLGLLYIDLRKFAASEIAFTEALTIFKKLAEKSPEMYLSSVAITQNNLGILYLNIRKFEAGESACTEALEIRKKIAEKVPEVYLSDVAMTQINLGNLYRNLRKFAASEIAFTDALAILKKLVEKAPAVYLPNFALTQNNLGILYHDLRKFEAAESAYTDALTIRKKLAQTAPDVYLLDVAMTQNNLGILYHDLRKFEAAESAYTDALEIRKKLAQTAPEVYLPVVAETQNNLGILYSDLRKFEAAKSAYTEALAIRKKLAQTAPDVYLPDYLQTMANIGTFYFKINKIEDGINILENVLKRRDLLPNLGASCFAVLGIGYKKTGKKKKAAQNYFIASSVYFLLFRKYGVPCLDDVVSNLKEVPELSDGEFKGDAQLILAAISKLSGGEVEIPDVPVSKRGAVLKEALNGRRIEFKVVVEADMMIKTLIEELLK